MAVVVVVGFPLGGRCRRRLLGTRGTEGVCRAGRSLREDLGARRGSREGGAAAAGPDVWRLDRHSALAPPRRGAIPSGSLSIISPKGTRRGQIWGFPALVS